MRFNMESSFGDDLGSAPEGPPLRRRTALTALGIALGGSTVLSSMGAASAATHVDAQLLENPASTLESFASIWHAAYNDSTRKITVTLDVKKEIPSNSGFSLYWEHPKAARSAARFSVTSIGNVTPGLREYTLDGPAPDYAFGHPRVVLSLARPNEQIASYCVVNHRGETVQKEVSAAEAVANALAPHLVGITISLVPQTRLIKAAGALFEAFNIYVDVSASLGLSDRVCPQMVAGNFISNRTTLVPLPENAGIGLEVWFSVYKDIDEYVAANPLCSGRGVVASWT